MGISFRGGRRGRSSRASDAPPKALEKIGRAVLRLRLYHGWSQAMLEHRSGVDQTTISRLERGQQRGLSIGRLAAVVDALDAGDVVFDQPTLPFEPTSLELLLLGDSWAKACREADRRLDWPDTATISTHSPSEPEEATA